MVLMEDSHLFLSPPPDFNSSKCDSSKIEEQEWGRGMVGILSNVTLLDKNRLI